MIPHAADGVAAAGVAAAGAATGFVMVQILHDL